MTIITRFAPSPTGMLHIGGARTALFNYLFTKKNNGRFLLRIEDTDEKRSTEEATQAILDGLKWLNIDYDGSIVMQSQNYDKHLQAAKQMIENGTAYYAYDTEEELQQMRQKAESSGQVYKYDGSKWRDQTASIPKDVLPTIRLKIPKEGRVVFKDLIRGELSFDNSTLDDLVLIRSSGVPTYMLAVVVDDINMNITHIIRGDDHISNTPKQILIYLALNKPTPVFAHLPMIHDIEGKKLSKRRNSVAVSDYAKEGYLSDAICNYLLHLGWNDGTEKEIFSRDEAINAFSIERCGKSPSRFDFSKLKNINLHYIQNLSNNDLLHNVEFILKEKLNKDLSSLETERFLKIANELKKSNLLTDIVDNFVPFFDNFEIKIINEDLEYLKSNIWLVREIVGLLKDQNTYTDITVNMEKFTKENNIKFGVVAPVIRLLLIGKRHSLGVYKILEVFQYNEIIDRVNKTIELNEIFK